MTDGSTISWLGKGVYSKREASRLLRVPVDKVDRWLLGKTTVRRGVTGGLKPVVVAKIEQLDDRVTLTFTDLIELLFVRGFRETGLSLQYIRAAAEKAADLFKTSHPFALKQFATDGRRIFSTLEVDDGDRRIMDLLRDQLIIPSVMDRYLTQLDYDLGSGSAIRWWPRGKQGMVRIDPRVSFGAPTVPSGVPTETLHKAFLANGQDPSVVASWYEVPEADVRAAVDYESELSERRAA
jgi:uncharacterized protein (DUF433 family)